MRFHFIHFNFSYISYLFLCFLLEIFLSYYFYNFFLYTFYLFTHFYQQFYLAAGRRSRRNSFTEDSQLTIENFGGSQDQINMLGRHPEPERKFSSSTLNFVTEPAVAVRSSIADARGTLQISYNEHDSGSEKQDRETEKLTMRRQTRFETFLFNCESI